MRGHHSQYIAMVNAMTEPWYVPVGRRKVVSTRPLVYGLPDGDVEIPAGVVSDLFTGVSNTEYIEFHKSAFLHDYERRKGSGVSREVADWHFAWDQMMRIERIRQMYLRTDCPQPVVQREIFRLTRLSAAYAWGVAGPVGSVYMLLDKWS